MPLTLLSPLIRKYIYDKKWETLRPIQLAAITKIISTNSNYILASRTASGKTEAAFLPIISKVNFQEKGVQVLYISPLIALINDQFVRIEELCKYLDIDVTKWHGEANKTLKQKLLKNPRDIVLITPESLEAMLVNAPYNVKHLFSNLKFIVIDEIHSFLGTDRGTQLRSLIFRLKQINNKFNVVGLSATIGDYVEAKKITCDEDNTIILLDKTSRELEAQFKYFESDTMELPIDLIKDLYLETKDNKALIFPNSRGRAEEIAVKLKKIAEKVKGHLYYFSHHSSVDKELREYTEHFAKNNQRNNFCISCTSTLELGIDIGTIDKVVQIDSAHSVSSLIQRVGRSGRREGEIGNLILYSTDKWNLLQSLACWLLYKEGFVEPVHFSEKPYDILLHQALSIVKQLSACSKPDLISLLLSNPSFQKITETEISEIIDELIKTDLLELLQNELIIGVAGEQIANSRDFYSMFKTELQLKVLNSGKSIGEIPFTPQLQINENIFLAAKVWKIVDVDLKSNKVEVIPAKDGKKPLFLGTGGNIHPKIREKMLEILFTEISYEELNDTCKDILQIFRKEFSHFKIENFATDRPVIAKHDKTLLYSFQGTRVNKSLQFLLNESEINSIYNENSSSFEISIDYKDFNNLIKRLCVLLNNIEPKIEEKLLANSSLLNFSKWGKYLPIKYQKNLLRDNYFDFQNTKLFLEKIKVIT
ncbi:MAG TPA: DEAD/DEAH box helicase [Ignavibacteria bacterium]|nr:DEAD/DEAH box helicase [Ignavibacteria bacterium]